MPDSGVQCDAGLPRAVVDAVRCSLESVYAAFFSEMPMLLTGDQGHQFGPCITGIISFIGDASWSLSWVLTDQTATMLAKRFAGFEIPFDSPDMGDMTGELVNVIAGEIVSQLEHRRIKAQMSLPTVVRGDSLELVPDKGPAIANLAYASNEGNFWFRLAVARRPPVRIPGK